MSEDVQIFINDKRLEHFSGFSMSSTLDSVGDQFAFTSPFYPDDPEYRRLFRPFKYQDVHIDIGGQRRFTGRMERPRPSLVGTKNTVSIQGRSLPGVLVDVSFERPVTGDKLQFTKAGLPEIAASVLRNYDFDAVFEGDIGAIFEEVGPTSTSQKLFDFLQSLAKQRKFLMGQTFYGDLLFRRAVVDGAPVAALIEGQQGVTISTADYDGTARYSSYDVFGQEAGVNDKFARVEDPALAGIHRPVSAQANDTNAGNIVDSANWIATLALAEAIDIPLEVTGWRDPDGELWRENTLITLQAPSIMVYKPSPFVIKRVLFNQHDAEERATLSLTIPGALSGSMPEGYPWDD